MKKLLSHAKTKSDLAEYLAERTIEHAERNGTRVVVVYGCESKGNKKDMSYLKSDQEEADTKIVLHALDATASGATEIRIHSPGHRCLYSLSKAISRSLPEYSVRNRQRSELSRD